MIFPTFGFQVLLVHGGYTVLADECPYYNYLDSPVPKKIRGHHAPK